MRYKLNKFKLPPNFRGRNAFVVQLWWFIDWLFFKPSPQVLYSWRVFLLRLFGAKIGKGVIIRPSVSITYPWKLKIRNYSWIGDYVVLYTLGEIEIGENSVISQKSYICTGSHDYQKEDFPIFAKKISIGNSCWLASDVFVGPGVTICDEVVVGSRSSIYKPIIEKGQYHGNPVKKINKSGF